MLVLIGIRLFSPEDTRICDGGTLVTHGNPSASSSGFSCSWWKLHVQSLLTSQDTSMKIITDFVDNGPLPSMYTCDGEGYFPHLKIEDVPVDAQSIVLIVDDPDAPSGVRDHLLLANVPIPEFEDLVISQDTFDLWVLGENGWWEQAWWAPCPPKDTHRYFFKVYVLSDMLEVSSWFSKERLMELMWGKILAQTQIVWLYTR